MSEPELHTSSRRFHLRSRMGKLTDFCFTERYFMSLIFEHQELSMEADVVK